MEALTLILDPYHVKLLSVVDDSLVHHSSHNSSIFSYNFPIFFATEKYYVLTFDFSSQIQFLFSPIVVYQRLPQVLNIHLHFLLEIIERKNKI